MGRDSSRRGKLHLRQQWAADQPFPSWWWWPKRMSGKEQNGQDVCWQWFYLPLLVLEQFWLVVTCKVVKQQVCKNALLDCGDVGQWPKGHPREHESYSQQFNLVGHQDCFSFFIHPTIPLNIESLYTGVIRGEGQDCQLKQIVNCLPGLYGNTASPLSFHLFPENSYTEEASQSS